MKAYPNYTRIPKKAHPIRELLITISICIGIAVVLFTGYCIFWAICS